MLQCFAMFRCVNVRSLLSLSLFLFLFLARNVGGTTIIATKCIDGIVIGTDGMSSQGDVFTTSRWVMLLLSTQLK
jgi:hypothetical protein